MQPFGRLRCLFSAPWPPSPVWSWGALDGTVVSCVLDPLLARLRDVDARTRHHPGVQHISTTVLGLVGSPDPARLRALAGGLGERANVRAVLPEADEPALDRAVAAWRAAAGAHLPFLVHDADPLAEVAAAWVDRWDGAGDIGRLEVAVQAALQRWRAGSLALPDYYLVVGAEELAATARHWYLGVLASAAPHRVVVTEDDHDVLVRSVRGLRAGRWWPELDRLLADVDRRVPDQLVVEAPEASSLV